jgi:hypothetical protein
MGLNDDTLEALDVIRSFLATQPPVHHIVSIQIGVAPIESSSFKRGSQFSVTIHLSNHDFFAMQENHMFAHTHVHKEDPYQWHYGIWNFRDWSLNFITVTSST